MSLYRVSVFVSVINSLGLLVVDAGLSSIASRTHPAAIATNRILFVVVIAALSLL